MSDSPYNYEFDVSSQSTAAQVCRYVGFDKDVLELGCAYGVMTRVLVEHYRCKVLGVEYDVTSAERARAYCSDVKIADLNQVDWADMLGNKTFDVIVVADVLEHLIDPLDCLNKAKKYLRTGGYFVLSLPNLAHNGIISELLSEDFNYRRTGLLDSTHVRFFGYKSLIRMIEGAELKVTSMELTRIPVTNSEFAPNWEMLPVWLKEIFESRPLGDVYQFVLTAESASTALATNHSNYLDTVWNPDPNLNPDLTIARYERLNSELRAERDFVIGERDAAISNKNAVEANLNQLKMSRSWRLTSPLRFSVRVLKSGFTRQDQEIIMQIIRINYHRLPLSMPVKRVIRFIYKRVFCGGFKLLRRLAPREAKFILPSYKPMSQSQNASDYIIWGVIDWHFRIQRPQQLARALTEKGRRVFYISPAFLDDDRAGFEAEALDDSNQIFQIKMFAKGAPSIYANAPNVETIDQLRLGIGELLDWANCGRIVSLVDHPFWCDIASVVPNNRLVYDCMDHHEGFGNNDVSLVHLEQQLVREAELTISTSTWLDEAVAGQATYRALIRNAGEYKHFAKMPESIYRDLHGRRVIGYYGAIAEWFDLDLVEAVALRHPDCSVLLIGADSINAKSRLEKLHNVSFTGEVPYSKLPHYLHGFDVCLLPFKVIPLTLATNPVKVYEYLSAGKPVVTVDLPEMVQFEGLVYAAADKDAFLAAVSGVLGKPEPNDLIQQRKAFAAGQTWQHRVEALIQQSESSMRDPKVSVIVVTYNNIELTRACLESLDKFSQYEQLEIIVVDNASSDGTPTYLSDWVVKSLNRKLILNDNNKGFAAANNQGLAVANGEYLVLLNNDTYVTPGWIQTLIRHLKRDKTIGLIGPITNNIGNEAKIDIFYESMDEMHKKSAAYTRRHIGLTYPLKTAAFFCVMLPRSTYERVGSLDEAFGRGFFEDDDYCRRVEQLGLRVVCAEDVFIHHHLSASFNKLKQHDRQKLFEENKKIYETKWGQWHPHAYRRH